MLKRGVYLAPSQFEAGFLSTAHTRADIEENGVCRLRSVHPVGLLELPQFAIAGDWARGGL